MIDTNAVAAELVECFATAFCAAEEALAAPGQPASFKAIVERLWTERESASWYKLADSLVEDDITVCAILVRTTRILTRGGKTSEGQIYDDTTASALVEIIERAAKEYERSAEERE